MRLLFLSPTFPPQRGGAESLFDDLARIAGERGHSVRVLAEARSPGEPPEERHGARVLRLGYPSFPRRLREAPAFLAGAARLLLRHARLLRAWRTDSVVVGRLDEKAWYPILLRPLLRFRLVVYLHGAELRFFARRSRAWRVLLRAAFRASDAVVAVSPGLEGEARAFHPAVAPRLHRIPNGVDVARLRARPPAHRARRYALFVGRLAPVKNPALLLRAFAKAAPALPDVDLVLVGSGECRAGLERLAADAGLASRVALLGDLERDEVFSLVRGAELLVLPSLAEGMPLAILEAFAAGRVVLGADVKGIRDLVREGETGALFAPGDADALAALLVRYADPAARAPLEARLAALDTSGFDLARVAELHLGVARGPARGGGGADGTPAPGGARRR